MEYTFIMSNSSDANMASPTQHDGLSKDVTSPGENRSTATVLACYWLVDVDRDFKTGHVCTGTRLYHMVASGSMCYVIVRTRALNQDGSVTVNASDGKTYLLLTEPSITNLGVSIRKMEGMGCKDRLDRDGRPERL
jgi:hypothetical protein